jgi:hypothetical protein
MDRSTTGSRPEAEDKPPARKATKEERAEKKRLRREWERVAKARIITCILDSNDTDPERNTLTRLFEKLESHIARSTLHKYLKQLVDIRWLIEESDEIRANRNQPMKVVRYRVNPTYAAMTRQMADDVHARDRGL